MKHYLILFLLAYAMTGYSQPRFGNTVKLSTCTFFAPGKDTKFGLLKQVGLTYERKVYRNIYAGISYQEWWNWSRDNFKKKWGTGIAEGYVHEIELGNLWQQFHYKFVDLFGGYRFNIAKGHFINAAAGAGYCVGDNLYIIDIFHNPEPPFDGVYATDLRREEYFGFIPQLSYDYFFLKDRFCIGADFRGRYYTGRSPQYDYGLHAGVSF